MTTPPPPPPPPHLTIQMCDMVAILFSELGQDYSQTSFPRQYTFSGNVMKLSTVF